MLINQTCYKKSWQKEKDAQEVELYSIENNDVPIEIGVKNE